MSDIDRQCLEIETLIERLVSANARTQAEQSDYNERYNDYLERYDKLQKRRREVSSAIAMCAAKRVQITGFLRELKKYNAPLLEFDERVWQASLNYMKVLTEGKVLFVFRDGTELPWTVDCEVRKYDRKKKGQ
ncbi:MAG: hypothetical protein CVU97_03875 [Firmicutes bacterium HGW-Firmicutes-21]|nr:MAG: hypothetical protein CVU97_03875 [Firmicutes bacterium HGW-Firmicutes-21]